MDITNRRANAVAMANEMQWLATVIQVRMQLYFGKDCTYKSIEEVPVPDIDDAAVYRQILGHYNVNLSERLILALALAPHVQPNLLDVFFVKNADYDCGFTEFGGIRGMNHKGYIPTGETAAFLLGPNDLESRFTLNHILGTDHYFSRFNILKLVPPPHNEPILSGMLTIQPEYLNLFTTGETLKPAYSNDFPAKLINTTMDWSDIVIDGMVMEEVMQIKAWITHGDILMQEWGLRKKVKPGYRSLFYGPPGTGKTLTACLLGKSTGLDVYRIDLSQIVSKYIGETEKSIGSIFDQAENKNWILFFDQADALFGKRTQNTSSNDRQAGEQITYLLQRIADYPGVVILSTNYKANIDEAFSSRFQSMIYFPVPSATMRLRLWQNAFSGKCTLEDAIDINKIAETYELTGGAIINVLRHCALSAISRESTVVTLIELEQAIGKELHKQGKQPETN